MFEKGDRVQTCYGSGVVDCFEVLNDKVTYIDEHPNPNCITGRICVTLDEGHTWSFKNTLCCFYQHELTKME